MSELILRLCFFPDFKPGRKRLIMYHILAFNKKLMYQTASSRDELNAIADKLDANLDGLLPEYGVREERYYGDGKLSYDNFIKQNPDFKDYKRCKTGKDFLDY